MESLVLIATVLSRLCFAEPAIDDGLIFYVPFDGFKVDAAVARGNPKSSFAKSIELRNHPGVKGGALMLQENERCDYQLKGNLNPRRGTIACWFKPINWDADDGMFHHFVCIKAPKIPFAWYIYKYYRPNNLMTYLERRRGKQRQRVSCGTSMKEWKRDRWHHVAVTWDSRELRLYADGQLSGKQLLPPEFMPDEFDGTISLAPVGYWKNKWCPPEARTLLDEVRIYDRDLSAREVLELFEKLNPYGNPESRRPSLTVSLNPDIAASRLVASVAALHLDTFWRNAVAQETKLSVEISGPGGIIEKKSIAFAPDAEVAVFVKKWQDGEYSVKAAVEHKGKALAASAQIRKPPTPWLTVKPAVRFIDSVLPPYSPLELKDETIVCWGRSIRLGSGPLPESIQSQGKELLRSPIALRGKIAGRDFTVGGKTVVTYVAGHRITFAGSQEIAGPQDKVAAVSWKGFVEFDGLVRTDISIAPRQGQMNIDSLRIDIPLSPSIMRYIRTPKRKDWKQSRFESPFLNYVWVGDEYLGLSWFMESDANFLHRPDSTVITVDKKSGQATLSLISDPATTSKALRYTVGFQATPLKPLPRGWAEWRLAHPGYKLANMMTHGWGPKIFTLFGSLVPMDTERHMKLLKKWHDQGLAVFPYAASACEPDLSEEWPFFQAEWYCAFGSTFPGYKRWPDNAPYSMRSVCIGSSASDFLVYRVEQMLKNGWGDGLYTDIDNFVGCDNGLHGCGYKDAFGRRGKTIPIFRHRDLSKRLYGLCHEYRGRYLSHMHNMFVSPYHAFIDGWCPGEHHSVAVVGKHTFYMDGLPLDDWRAEYCSPTTGIPTFMLPQWGRISPKSDKEVRFPTENLVAMLALHNVPLWAGHTNREVVQEYWQALADFGIADAKFLPYWETPPVTTTAEDVRISVYRKPKSQLVAVVNFSQVDRLVPLTIRKTPKTHAVVLPVGVSTTVKERVIFVPVRAKNLSLVRLDY